jgi:hypothetical protein
VFVSKGLTISFDIFKYDGISRFHSARLCSDGLFPHCRLLPPNNSQGHGRSSLVDPQSPKLIIRASEIWFLMLLSLVAMGCHHDSATTASSRLDFRAQAPVYDTERPTSCDLVLQFHLGSILSTRTERLSISKPTLARSTIKFLPRTPFDYQTHNENVYAIYPTQSSRQTTRRSFYSKISFSLVYAYQHPTLPSIPNGGGAT